ncbi:putative lipoprotein LppH [Mycolicibacterium phlei]|uniref:sensor domain-containing protein n=1 Tax=Mycolicibacterium phlei TaxID=1771 RepID=UPI00058E60A7|nr:sensor domain-containing protein [Mycolicibacterium phlei]AMO61105.1 Serine/threonine-protein kinase PknH [Mycolicibacterium phlei]KXW77757.1 hypothetical protein JL15_09675 [Mycolicibacterium phlei DSM 43071]STZ17899.1 putative lipoprotein LppH [Mycolicibacterium phlei]VEG09221.1 putative lipoprotein LppH [Mycobacteroides chelonae]
MRRVSVAISLIAVCLVASGCAEVVSNAVATTQRSLIPRPLVARELPELLLEPAAVDAAVGTAGMAVTSTQDQMADNSATMAPFECLAVDGAAEAPVYADSGFTASLDQSLNNGDNFTHYAKQAVVLYPLVDKARAFLEASAQQWQGCREYTHTQTGTVWTPGPVSFADDVLSVVSTLNDAAAPGWACERALALENNVIIDVNTCSAQPAGTAVRIAEQIAERVAARW